MALTRLPKLRVLEIGGHPHLRSQQEILQGLKNMKSIEDLRFQWDSPKKVELHFVPNYYLRFRR